MASSTPIYVLTPKWAVTLADAGTSGTGAHLLRNIPGAEPSKEELARGEAQHVKAWTEGMINDVLAERRVSTGLVDPYFDKMATAFQAATLHPPPMKLPSMAEAFGEGYLAAAGAYGRTGDPFADDEGRTGHADESALRRRGISQAIRIKTPSIVAIVEFQQGPKGVLESTRLLTSSGDKQFDDFVMDRAPRSLEQLPAPPPSGSGIHVNGMRTVWAFIGMRASSNEHASVARQAGLSLLGGVAGSALAETVDKATQDKGAYTCTAKLLRAY